MNKDKTKLYLGNFYGQKDSYDGAVFDPKGLCPALRARTGGQVYIIRKKKDFLKKDLTH